MWLFFAQVPESNSLGESEVTLREGTGPGPDRSQQVKVESFCASWELDSKGGNLQLFGMSPDLCISCEGFSDTPTGVKKPTHHIILIQGMIVK